MSAIFVALDADNEPTLWLDNGLFDPTALARRCDMGQLAWALIETHPAVVVRETVA